jgi:hypothetical protein
MKIVPLITAHFRVAKSFTGYKEFAVSKTSSINIFLALRDEPESIIVF